MATIYDVAKAAGVSITTVSRVINGRGKVRPETRRRVEEAMKSLDFIPNPSARSLTLRRSRIVALVVPDISNPFYGELARGAQDRCDRANYSLLICSTNGDPAKERDALERLCRQQIDGLCVVRYFAASANLRAAMERGKPLVVIGSRPPELALDSVTIFGTGDAVREIVRRLWEAGRRRLALITGDEATVVGTVRRRQFDALVDELDLERDPDLAVITDFSRAGGCRAAERLFSLPKPPDMIFCANDVIAAGVVQAAKRRGIAIPGDVAVFGCDNIEIAALIEPPLTSVHIPKYELGFNGMELLFERIGNREAPIHQRSLQALPVFRESTQEWVPGLR